jgi:hypothetical protein
MKKRAMTILKEVSLKGLQLPTLQGAKNWGSFQHFDLHTISRGLYREKW